MKQLRKGIALLLAALLTLAGCSSDGQRFFSALESFSETTYYEQKNQVSFSLKYSGGDKDFQDNMRSMKHLIDALTFDINATYEGNVKSGSFKSHISAESSLEPFKVFGEAWLNLDLAKENPKYEITVKIPALAKALLPEEQAKEFLYIDYFEYFDTLTASISGSGLMRRLFSSAFDMQLKGQDIFDSFKEAEALSGYFSFSSKVEGQQEKLTLTMSDAQFKGFVTAFLNELISNEKILDGFVELLNSSADFAGLYGAYVPYNKDQLKELIITGISEAMPLIEKSFQENTILGSDGLVLELTLDKDGRIINEDLALTFNIYDTFGSFLPYSSSRNPGVAELTVKINSVNSGLDKNGSVKFPTLTEENSLDAVRAIKEEAERQKERSMYYFPYSYYSYDSLLEIGETPVAFPLTGSYKGTNLTSSINLINAAEHAGYPCFCISLRQAAELFGGKIEWNEEYKLASWKLGENVLVILPSDFEENAEYYQNSGFFVSGFRYNSRASYIIDGTMFVGLADIESFLDVDFGFNNDTKTVLIK